MAAALLLFVACTENVQVYTARSEQEQYTVEDVAFLEMEDDSAPAGVRQIYCWTLREGIAESRCLAFYLVHQCAEVYLDQELVYSLMPEPDNRIGRTVGSNWVFVPLYPSDSCKEVRVEIIPVYKSVRDRMVTFYEGTHLRIYLKELKRDLPQIVLSILVIAVGTVFVVMSLYNCLKWRNRQGAELIYLGLFSMHIGVWRLSDTRFSSMLFQRNPLLLYDISLVMFLMGAAPLLLYIRRCSKTGFRRALDVVCLLSILAGMVIIILQMTNIADFKESLPAIHAVIILGAGTITLNEIQEWKQGKRSAKSRVMTGGFLLCIAGMLVDLILFYVRGNSAGILYTLAAFLIYVVFAGIMTNRELNYRAHIDMHTGLYNKSSCSERLDEKTPVTEPTAVFMFDLNGLKRVNDTVGHDAGDNMIFRFADILRKNLPANAFAGRYGGDEFIAILQPADDAAVRRVLADVADAVERNNQREAEVPISYAAGSAISTEHPGEPLRKLLEAADTAMYEDKRRQYAAGQAGV